MIHGEMKKKQAQNLFSDAKKRSNQSSQGLTELVEHPINSIMSIGASLNQSVRLDGLGSQLTNGYEPMTDALGHDRFNLSIDCVSPSQ